MTAYNERFGTTAAVTSLKVSCGHERKYPAERAVSVAAAPSRRSLYAMQGQCYRQTTLQEMCITKKYPT